MSKYSRTKNARKARRWFKNVGDGAKLTKEGTNVNDKPAK